MNVRRIALVGQPNSGKSTLFNALVGWRAVASNFPGTTVEILRGGSHMAGQPVEVVDLPGTYSLSSGDRAEEVTRAFLTSGEVDAVVHAIDASLLSRSLELTLELAELAIPMVLCLNMMDEARRKGVAVDQEKLAQLLGVPVVATVATRGVGLPALLAALPNARPANPPRYSADVEQALTTVENALASVHTGLPPRYMAIQALAGAPLPDVPPAATAQVHAVREALARTRGEDPALVLADERHAQAVRTFEAVAQVTHAHLDWRDQADSVLMHRYLGYPILGLVLFALFWIVFQVGSTLERLLREPLSGLTEALAGAVGPGAWGQVAVGAMEGLWAGLALVLPYLVPFLLLLALLEDVGYLPRAAFLLDGLMHRMGLHGKSVIPFLLGYGCSVPAVLATRILEDDRDRLVTAALAVMVPCAGRAIVVFGLVGRFMGPLVALGLYLLNAAVIAVSGTLLRRFLPGMGPGLILEIPPYRRPGGRTTLGKVWLRLRDFVAVAWPLLVGTSAVFALAEALGWAGGLNAGVRFLTWPLGLPPEAGVPLVFGLLRKELSLVMLTQAFGTADLSAVLAPGQMVIFTVFVLFYMPCVATLAALGRELGPRRTGLVFLGTTGVALLVGLLLRGLASLA
ncbi:MAG: ferrous iron transport protein B [Candidatus Acetothermia bacterium]|nr:ferrous iron transport protein B [Candidatus Acetothermia bacterium]